MQHNTWKTIGDYSQINLVVDQSSIVQLNGSIKVSDYILSNDTCLVFQLVYKVQINDRQGKSSFQDFVIGWCIAQPILNEQKNEVLDWNFAQELILGPGFAITGETLWDPTFASR